MAGVESRSWPVGEKKAMGGVNAPVLFYLSFLVSVGPTYSLPSTTAITLTLLLAPPHFEAHSWLLSTLSLSLISSCFHNVSFIFSHPPNHSLRNSKADACKLSFSPSSISFSLSFSSVSLHLVVVFCDGFTIWG